MVGAFWEKLHCIISRSRALVITLSTSANTGNHGDFHKQPLPLPARKRKVGTLVSETSEWYVCTHQWHRFRTLCHFIVFKAHFNVLSGVNRCFKELKIFLKLMNVEKFWVNKVISLHFFLLLFFPEEDSSEFFMHCYVLHISKRWGNVPLLILFMSEMPLGDSIISVGQCSLKDFVQHWTLWSESSWILYYHEPNRSFQAFPLQPHSVDSSCRKILAFIHLFLWRR